MIPADAPRRPGGVQNFHVLSLGLVRSALLDILRVTAEPDMTDREKVEQSRQIALHLLRLPTLRGD